MGTTLDLTASDGHKLSAYRANPAGEPKGALVVVQEIFGVNRHIRAVCDGFAANGYVAIAPALFDRVEPGIELGYEEEDRQRGFGFRQKIGWDEAMADIEAARDAVSSLAPLGLVGYCWGGSLAWLAAVRISGFKAVVTYYGGQIVDFKDDKALCPVMMHFGEVDLSIELAKVDEIKAAQPGIPVFVYDGAGHGFNCDLRGSYHADASKLAGERTMAFLQEHVT
jgi:carboxymethylenebutenolidase